MSQNRNRQAELLEIVATTPAKATIREGIDGRRHFVVHGPLVNLDGGEIGTFRGVLQAKIFSKSDLLEHPDPPSEPFDRPYAATEPEWTPLLNPAKLEWTFDEVGHVIRGSGSGLSRIAVLPEGGSVFWYSVTAFAIWRDGTRNRSLGQATSLVTGVFPAVPSLTDGVSFSAQIMHTLSLAAVG